MYILYKYKNDDMEYNFYCLELDKGKKYIGKTKKTLKERFHEHTNYIKSNQFVKKYRILNIIPLERLNKTTKCTEDFYVKDYMVKYGIDNVRGGSYTNINLSEEEKIILKREMDTANDKCRICGDNNCSTSTCLGNFFPSHKVHRNEVWRFLNGINMANYAVRIINDGADTLERLAIINNDNLIKIGINNKYDRQIILEKIKKKLIKDIEYNSNINVAASLYNYNQYSLNSEQHKIYNSIKNGDSCCIIGQGGTGKSYLGKYTFKNINKYIIQVSLTGKASQQLIIPRTLHSLFGLGLYCTEFTDNPKDFLKKIKKSIKWINLINYLSDKKGILWIDECFGFTKENFKTLCKAIKYTNKEDKRRLRGIQLILVGDPAQLKGIGRKTFEYNKDSLCFKAKKWNKIIGRNIFCLNKNIRAKEDILFSKDLKSVRFGLKDKHINTVLNNINKRRISIDNYKNIYQVIEEYQGSTIVTPYKNNRKEINKYLLTKLTNKTNPIFKYTRIVETDNGIKLCNNIVKFLDKNLSYDVDFEYCIGSLVMLKINLDTENGLINGINGEIIDIDKSVNPHILKIKFENGLVRNIKPQSHKSCVYLNYNVIAYPLISGPAITIHSIQGSTIKNKLIFNMNAERESGKEYWYDCLLKNKWTEQQFYTVMSRCTKYEDFLVYCTIPIKKEHIRINDDVYDLLRHLKR